MRSECGDREGRNGRGTRTAREPQTRRGAEGQLIRSLKKGDQEALKSLIKRNHARLYNHVEGICRNPADTEEVLQDTYVRAWNKIGDFEGRASLFSWMYRIAANGALMKRRKERRWRSTVPIDDPTRFHENEGVSLPWDRRPDSPEETLLDNELREEICRARTGLAEIYRAVFDLRELQGFTIKETCDELDLTPGAVKSRLRRSRRFMRASLRHYVETG